MKLLNVLGLIKILKNQYLYHRHRAHRKKLLTRARPHVIAKDIVSTLNGDTRFTLGAMTRIRGEDEHLNEWLDFHIYQGVEHFFIYDSDSSKNTLQILAPYIRQSLVTYIPWPDIHHHTVRLNYAFFTSIKEKQSTTLMQHLARDHFMHNYAKSFDWIVMFDADEFIYTD